MVTELGWYYLGAGTLLFFFWAYGVVSFGLDLKNKIIPGIRGMIAEREAQKAEEERERERDEKKQQLY
ncbi:hypothetical protein ZOD2009_04937 [Haladaptatus paucihalophilus DX253]|uniref:CcmD family protein n=1 Tax=Haladaptatus paucihalophilus DX253 TaxID=797209 RepID=E7QQB7_HALPU|nr:MULTISPECIES: hypothetical protein [Haladaptatus]EFW93181.1 hypothetical protein ZOD2009_04937 [Haladaptatus paucihalophilus DX253]GKZ12579.1 hypothetical protein HAL_04600 [Haladaptatus sp. T7]SHK47180.1 hypothetical protein SAMN05444342_1371 [Haladaptatus paucihalophilus DX253]